MPLYGEGNGKPLQYSCLENPMDGGAWWAAVHEVPTSWTQLSDFTFTFHFDALEEEVAIHSSVLSWRIPGTGGPDGPLSLGSHRVGHDWSDLAAAAAVRDYSSSIGTKSCPTLATPGIVPARLLCPWNFPGENTRVGCRFLLQGIEPRSRALQEVFLQGRQILSGLRHQGSPTQTIILSFFNYLWTS